MGEPLPGDIPDPIYLKTTNVALAGAVVQTVGDWLQFASAKSSYDAISVTTPRLLVGDNIVQLQQDVDTTGIADGVNNASAFGNGSWVYAFCGGVIEPNSEVYAVVFDNGALNEVGFAQTVAVTISSIAVVTLVGTVTTAVAHNLRVGDTFAIAGTGEADDGSSFQVVSVTSATVFVFTSAAADYSAVIGTITQDASINHNGQAMFIKVSGQTVVASAALGNIGIFSLTGKGSLLG